MSSYDGVAYMKVSGSLINLKCISTNRKPDEFYGDSGNEVYQGGGYKVWINFKYAAKRDQEVWLYKGLIKIEHLNKKAKSQIKIIGETGC